MRKPYLFYIMIAFVFALSACATSPIDDDIAELVSFLPKSASETVVEQETDEASPSDFESEVDITVEEEPVEEVIEEFVEEIAEDVPVEPVVEETPVVEDTHVEPVKEPIEIVSQTERLRSAKVGSTELPDWFVYISAALILASLFTIGYISKQRKESTWYRRGPRD